MSRQLTDTKPYKTSSTVTLKTHTPGMHTSNYFSRQHEQTVIPEESTFYANTSQNDSPLKPPLQVTSPGGSFLEHESPTQSNSKYQKLQSQINTPAKFQMSEVPIVFEEDQENGTQSTLRRSQQLNPSQILSQRSQFPNSPNTNSIVSSSFSPKPTARGGYANV